jgi:predicted NodU family carbamoyl transferase
MKILGISLGHDSSFSLIEDGKIIEIMEVERYFRSKRYKLSALKLSTGKYKSTYQYVDLEELVLFLARVGEKWGKNFDCLAVQNQGRMEEHHNLNTILDDLGFKFKQRFNVNHHLSHASLAFYTSPFSDALVLSYDGAGNDGYTLLFKGSREGINYYRSSAIRFGQCYNNLGFILGIHPDISGSTAGKTMGLAAYGKVWNDWLPYTIKHIKKYRKYPSKPVEGLNDYGRGHIINSTGLNNIPNLQDYLENEEEDNAQKLRIYSIETKIAHDLARTFQFGWAQEVIALLRKHKNVSDNLCVVGGCALNGITNYEIQKNGLFKNTHFVPNASDCGLSAGAALYVYYNKFKENKFSGYGGYLSPYLGEEVYDKASLPEIKSLYPHMELHPDNTAKFLAGLLYKDFIIGVVRGRYEIGPRALGNRSILCNPLNPSMRDILNQKVKHREWYRPFAPIATSEDAKEYFTNTVDIPYMSVICHTRPEYRSLLPSITHVDGSARLQTIRREHNPFAWELLKAFQKLSGFPILLNTSFNPGGEPILNYYKVALEMLEKTKLDMVLIEDNLFVAPSRKSLLKECLC